MSEPYSSKCSKSKSHLHPCREVKRLGHAPVTNGEEAETRTLPFLAPCLQLASLTGSQRSPKLTCSTACFLRPQGHPDFPCPSVFFSEMFRPAEVSEHSEVVAGSPGESSSVVKRKGSQGSGSMERKQGKEG